MQAPVHEVTLSQNTAVTEIAQQEVLENTDYMGLFPYDTAMT